MLLQPVSPAAAAKRQRARIRVPAALEPVICVVSPPGRTRCEPDIFGPCRPLRPPFPRPVIRPATLNHDGQGEQETAPRAPDGRRSVRGGDARHFLTALAPAAPAN